MKGFKVKNNPVKIGLQVQDLVKMGPVGPLRGLPVWYEAVKAHPPTTVRPSRKVDPVERGMFVGAPGSRPAYDPMVPVWTRGNPRKSRPRHTTAPPFISYPEDSLRQRFFEAHPFELLRPKTLIETEDDLRPRDWATLQDPASTDVSGEDVIQHAHYLMTAKAIPEKDAMESALTAFYKIRQQQDLERLVAMEAAQEAEEAAQKDEMAAKQAKMAADAAVAAMKAEVDAAQAAIQNGKVQPSEATQSAETTQTDKAMTKDSATRGAVASSASDSAERVDSSPPSPGADRRRPIAKFYTHRLHELEEKEIADSRIYEAAVEKQKQHRRLENQRSSRFDLKNIEPDAVMIDNDDNSPQE